MKRSSCILLVTLLLSGCQNFIVKPKEPAWPWVNVGDKNDNVTLCSEKTQEENQENKTGCTREDAMENFLSASNFCTSIYDQYRRDISSAKGVNGWVGIMGSIFGIAGSVTSGNTASLLSGFSGATNAFQASTTEMLSATATVGSLTAIQELTGLYNTSIRNSILNKKYDEAVFNAIRMAGECKYAASVIQNKMVNSILPNHAEKVQEESKKNDNPSKGTEQPSKGTEQPSNTPPVNTVQPPTSILNNTQIPDPVI